MDGGAVDQALALIDGAAPTLKPSLQRDVEAGRPSELESMIGVIWRKGRERGLATPTVDMVYAALRPGELKAQQGMR